MTKMTTFDSFRYVAVRGGLIVFLLALSLAHPQTSSRMAGAPATSAAEMSSALVNNWTVTGNLNAGRDDHTATLLPNGKVLVAGGFGNSGPLTSAELYDPANGAWTLTGNLNTGRFAHTATLLPNGKILVAGGFSTRRLNSAELYDP